MIWPLTIANEDIRELYIFDEKELGHGHYGSVRRAKFIKEPNKTYAIKTI